MPKGLIIKFTAFWGMAQCSFVEVDVSEVHTASIIRAIEISQTNNSMAQEHTVSLQRITIKRWNYLVLCLQKNSGNIPQHRAFCMVAHPFRQVIHRSPNYLTAYNLCP
jgi:hypothetical protein